MFLATLPKQMAIPFSSLLVKLIRRRAWQPFHERLLRFSKVGMNYWGGAMVAQSGERMALRFIAERSREVEDLVVFDVGANFGNYTSAVLEAMPSGTVVHAFEPSQAAMDKFREAIAGHPQGRYVQAHTLGLSNSKGNATLYAPFIGSGIGTLHPAPFDVLGSTNSTEAIELTTIDAFCSENGIERIDLLKIDAEGHELAVLQGARGMIDAGRVRFIQFEFGECHLDSRVFLRDFHVLLSPRYRIHRILPDGLWPLNSYSPDQEIFNTANYLAFAPTEKPL